MLRNGRWHYRGMFSEIPLPLDWPVYVTQRQAAAYAKWRGQRLPTEAEFHRAAWPENINSWRPDPESDNFDLRRWDPVPVTLGTENPNGLMQIIGNGWEWTSTPLGPFPGFTPFPFYPGYSADFFDGEHFVLKGASPQTAARLTRPSFRNWFRADYPYMYATFRVVEDR
jgi:iron(II)-dependent oxidoreductase